MDGEETDGYFMQRWKLEECTGGEINMFRIDYICVEGKTGYGSQRVVKKTECGETYEKKSHYLDRHDIRCDDGYALILWRLDTDDCADGDQRFIYDCAPYDAAEVVVEGSAPDPLPKTSEPFIHSIALQCRDVGDFLFDTPADAEEWVSAIEDGESVLNLCTIASLEDITGDAVTLPCPLCDKLDLSEDVCFEVEE